MCKDCTDNGISESDIQTLGAAAYLALTIGFPDSLYAAASQYIMTHRQLTLAQLDACFRRHNIPCYLYGEKKTWRTCPEKQMKVVWHDGAPKKYILRFACGVPNRSLAVHAFSPHLLSDVGENDKILAETGYMMVREEAREEVKATIKRNEGKSNGITPLRDNTVYFAPK